MTISKEEIFNSNKPKVLFFSRSFYANYFSESVSENYISIHATLKADEKELIEKKGGFVCGCFEEEFDNIKESHFEGNYLHTSYAADRLLLNRSPEERHKILAKEITFWRNILETYKPTIVVNETVALEVSEVLLIECERLGIDYHSFLIGILPATTMWKPSAMHGSLETVAQINYDYDEETLKTANEYFDSKKHRFEKSFYLADVLGKNRLSLKLLKKEIFNDIFRFKYYLTRKYFSNKKFIYEDISRNLFGFTKRYICSLLYNYDNFAKIKEKSYVFHPIHYEPEATLRYFSEFYDCQHENIKNIAKTLNTNQYLVVKEHPQQFGMLLTKRFRDLKRDNPNLVFLPSEIPSEDVIKNTEATVTLTSSAGWESLILGKPVLILGKMWWDNHPNVTKVIDYNHLRDLIRNKKYNYPSDEITIKYIAFLLKFHTDKGAPYPHPAAYTKENIIHFVSGVENLLKNKINK